jgi:hypothetical protein
MRKHLIIAGLILAFEAYVGIGLIGGSGMFLAVASTILAITERPRRSEWLRVALIYTLMFISTVALLGWNMQVAQRRAAPVILAVRRYNSEHGHYPKTLDELVPTYLPSIPRGGFTLISRHFRYFNYADPQLWIPAMFYGVVSYDFHTKTWRTND